MARRPTATRRAVFSIPIGWRGCCALPAPQPRAVPAIDTVYVDFRDSDGFRRECEEACRDGFFGKMAIHPAQVPIINEVFTPSADGARAGAIDRRGIRRQRRAPASSASAALMYDRPHLVRAQQLLARASTAKS